MTITRRYRFSASHRLHNPALSEEVNRAVYGKCNNRLGHGHDYVLEVSACGPVDEETGRVLDPACLDALVRERVLAAFDHRNLNAETPEFANRPSTSENLLRLIWERLRKDWEQNFPPDRRLVCVRLRETRRNSFEMMEEE